MDYAIIIIIIIIIIIMMMMMMMMMIMNVIFLNDNQIIKTISVCWAIYSQHQKRKLDIFHV